MVVGLWFRHLWKTPVKPDCQVGKGAIGVLSFEVANLMSKLVHSWQSLTDKHILRLREKITISVGIRKLVSEDEDFIVRLIYAEMFENIVNVAKSVARLCNNCSNPILKGFENALDEFVAQRTDPNGWFFTWKKMDKKVKKMERFISSNASFYNEMELLSELEQTFKRMKANDEPDTASLLEYQKKVAWKRQEVKKLQEMSLWNRTYDYTIILLVRCLFTTFNRIKHVSGVLALGDGDKADNFGVTELDNIYRSHSCSAFLQSSVHPSENALPRFASGPLGGLTPNSESILKTSKASALCSGPIGESTTKSGSLFVKNRKMSFFSGPLGRMLTNKSNKNGKILGHSATINGTKAYTKSNRLTRVGPFKVYAGAGVGSSVSICHGMPNDVHLGTKDTGIDNKTDILSNRSFFTFSGKLLDAPPDTLGVAALALHYANVVIVIEKFASSPHLIGLDARDDLYDMLPKSLRAALRSKLKPYGKTLGSALYDTVLAAEWGEAMSKILEWLAPLAHNMIRWQSERSYEQQNVVSRTNVLLVQTLYFANQGNTEALITELLVGLNYVWRCGRELNVKTLAGCASSRAYHNYMDLNV